MNMNFREETSPDIRSERRVVTSDDIRVLAIRSESHNMNLTTRFKIILLAIFGLAQAVADGQILVSSFTGGTVAEYSLSGQLINPSFMSGLNQPEYLAADSAGNIYVSNWGNNAVSKYT